MIYKNLLILCLILKIISIYETQEIPSFNEFRIRVLNVYLELYCPSNQTIMLETFKEKLEADNFESVSKISIHYCRMSFPLVEIVDILEANNISISEIVLNSVTSLEAQHLTKIDEKGISWLKLNFLYNKEALPVHVFSTIPKLPNLYIIVRKAEYLPDFSKLEQLHLLHIKITLSGIGNEAGESIT